MSIFVIIIIYNYIFPQENKRKCLRECKVESKQYHFESRQKLEYKKCSKECEFYFKEVK